MPDEREASGLLALMLLHDARRAARIDEAGDLVTLEEQDRSRWDRAEIDEGGAVLEAGPATTAGPGHISCRPRSPRATPPRPTPADTDWAQIARLYERLARLVPSPVVELNRAVAVAMADGPAAGLALVDALAATGELAGYHLLPATRADLLRRLGRRAEAAASLPRGTGAGAAPRPSAATWPGGWR